MFSPQNVVNWFWTRIAATPENDNAYRWPPRMPQSRPISLYCILYLCFCGGSVTSYGHGVTNNAIMAQLGDRQVYYFSELGRENDHYLWCLPTVVRHFVTALSITSHRSQIDSPVNHWQQTDHLRTITIPIAIQRLFLIKMCYQSKINMGVVITHLNSSTTFVVSDNNGNSVNK